MRLLFKILNDTKNKTTKKYNKTTEKKITKQIMKKKIYKFHKKSSSKWRYFTGDEL